jgi:NitT/TauT family transport system substrate-binding protein
MTNVILIMQAKTEGWVYAPLAKELGEFQKENLNVTIDYDQNPSDIVLALDHGQAAAGFIGVSALLFNVAAANPAIKITMGVGAPPPGTTGVYVKSSLIPASGTFDPCDLKGMRVGVGPALKGGVVTAGIGIYFQDHCPSVTINDLTLSPLQGANGLIALQTGALPAAALYPPISSEAKSTGVAKLVLESPPPGSGAMIMGGEMTSQPAVAQALVRAMLRTVRTYLQGDYHANPTVAAAIAQAIGVPVSTVTSPLNPSSVFDPTGAYPAQELVPLQNFFLSVTPKILTYSTPLDTADMVNNELTASALAGQ